MQYLKTKALLLMLPLFLLGTIIHAQKTETNIRTERKIGLSLKAGGATVFGFNIDAFLAPDINIEGSFLILPGYSITGAGIKYHPWGFDVSRQWSPYIGINAGAFATGIFKDFKSITFYPQVGIHYTGKKGFNFSIDLGPLAETKLDSQLVAATPLWGSIALGYRFLSQRRN